MGSNTQPFRQTSRDCFVLRVESYFLVINPFRDSKSKANSALNASFKIGGMEYMISLIMKH